MRSFLLAAFFLAACAHERPLATAAEIEAAERAPLTADTAPFNVPFAPFKMIGDTYYVGTKGVSAILIATKAGLIVIDGGLPQSAPQIEANIAALGFKLRDIRYILNSHGHYDHAGGVAALQRLSGAEVVAREPDRAALESGKFPYGPAKDFPSVPVRVDRVVADGESISLGGVTVTAHATPGHTKGCTSWSWPVTGADGAAHNAFFHCSSTVAGQSLAPESYPGMIGDFRATFTRIDAVHADIFIGAHPFFFDMEARRARQQAGDANAFVDASALRKYNDEMRRAFEAELSRQQTARP